MKPWGRFIFIFIAYGIALLHTAVPHHHAQARNGGAIFSHAGCHYAHAGGGLLQRVLSTDLGLGHLDTFKKNSDTKVQVTSRLVAVFILFVPDVAATLSLRAFPETLGGYIGKLKHHLLLFSVTHFRAPPALF